MPPPPASAPGILADVVVVNTCAVTAEAERQARQAIRRLKRERPQARIVVTGCAAQTSPDQFAAMDEVDRVIGNDAKMDGGAWTAARAALAAIPDFGIGQAEKIAVNDIMAVKETAAHLIEGLEGRARAFVQVQNGCDHRCTFCIIPYGRGNSRSVPMGAVVDEVRRLAAQWLPRGGADRRRSDELWRRPARRAEARRAGAPPPQACGRPAAAAALLARLHRDRFGAAGCLRHRGTSDAASAPLAPGRATTSSSSG